ncbi:MarR family winged helix-turn-helix transcriptional regulator [Paraburkholderia sediminicola]|uniref:MarR family winged helix-turn-helix transcriptional regulator n=1 Tax=Paraburkholderia sediminicola TaxID=458836 RepID=UPI0038BC9B35
MDHRLVYLLNVGQRRVHRWSQARTAVGGVTAAQAGLLFFLAKNDGALTNEAAAALDLKAPGMSGLVDRAEQAGLVERYADEFDRRASRLWLTENGRSALNRSKAGLAGLNARLTEGFTASEIEVVARWLTSLQERFPAIGEESD